MTTMTFQTMPAPVISKGLLFSRWMKSMTGGSVDLKSFPKNGLTAEVAGFRFDDNHRRLYNELCGWSPAATPITYPQAVAFGLHTALLTHPNFPLSPMGIVHKANTFSLLRPDLLSHQDFRVTAQLSGIRRAKRGTEFNISTRFFSGEELVWEGLATYLSLQRKVRLAEGTPGSDTESVETPSVTTSTETTWKQTRKISVPSSTGRDYAALTGDRNPIHTSPFLAKCLGQEGTIAHGMWTAAAALHVFESTLGRPMSATVKFVAPLPLSAGTIYNIPAFGVFAGPGHPNTDIDRMVVPFQARPLGPLDASVKPYLVGTISTVRGESS